VKKNSTRFAVLARRFRKADEGAVSILVAGMLVVLLGMTGLAVEVGLALFKRQQQQTVADAAAYSGALALAKPESLAAATGEAKATAANAGYADGVNSIVVTVNSPPVVSVAQAGNASALEVVIQQPLTMSLANLVNSWYGAGPINWTVQASSVATAGGSTPCALQLGASANPGVTIANGATVTLDNCGLSVCSAGGTALSMSGGTKINLTDISGNFSTIQNVSVTGQASVTGGSTINGAGSCSLPSCKQSQPICQATLNPYYARTFPTKTGKTLAATQNTSTTLSAGQWTNGVSFGGGAKITLSAGVYFVDNGTFTVGGGATVTSGPGGVTIVLAATGSSYSNVSIANGGAVTLTAPTTGPTAGIAFFGDPVVSGNNQGTETFTGGAVINITGAIYFPQQTVDFSGGVSDPSGCTQLIAGTINFQGGAKFSNNCASAGTSPIGGGGGATALVE
jgi:hypothetical protein